MKNYEKYLNIILEGVESSKSNYLLNYEKVKSFSMNDLVDSYINEITRDKKGHLLIILSTSLPNKRGKTFLVVAEPEDKNLYNQLRKISSENDNNNLIGSPVIEVDDITMIVSTEDYEVPFKVIDGWVLKKKLEGE